MGVLHLLLTVAEVCKSIVSLIYNWRSSDQDIWRYTNPPPPKIPDCLIWPAIMESSSYQMVTSMMSVRVINPHSLLQLIPSALCKVMWPIVDYKFLEMSFQQLCLHIRTPQLLHAATTNRCRTGGGCMWNCTRREVSFMKHDNLHLTCGRAGALINRHHYVESASIIHRN